MQETQVNTLNPVSQREILCVFFLIILSTCSLPALTQESPKSEKSDPLRHQPGVNGNAPLQKTAGSAPRSREARIGSRQAEKAKQSQPRPENKAEKWIRMAEGVLFEESSGFAPAMGSIYHGGGMGFGAKYKKYYGDNTFWSVKGLYSILNYKLAEAKTESRDHLGKRLSFGSRLGWRDATQVGYYGLETNTQREARANFRFQETYVDGHALFRPVRWIPLKGSVGYEHFNTAQGQGSFPSIETRYTPQSAPGLGADPTFLHSQLSAGIDWRPSEGYTRKGGLYQATFHDYRNNNGGIYSFQRLDGDVIQHIPLLRETWVLSMRGRVQTTVNENDLVPYFLLPALGSGRTLRAFDNDRFRGLHSLLMNVEFRWIPNPFGLDMALFYDAGKATNRRRDLNFKGLKSDVGIGARFHGPFSTPLRLDLAVGNEGWRLRLSSSAIF
ncbi:MAG TPA: hypothetical protein VFJ27_08515 [Terriglobia bacterium]|nr:hypothetical protein [Terriglobia bacterium]